MEGFPVARRPLPPNLQQSEKFFPSQNPALKGFPVAEFGVGGFSSGKKNRGPKKGPEGPKKGQNGGGEMVRRRRRRIANTSRAL